MNEFYGDAELFVPYETEKLARMIESTVAGTSVHRCDVAIEDGELVAGAHVVENHKLMSAELVELPPELERNDELPPSIPDDREIRPTFVIPWYEPGHESAAEALIDHERANAGDANRLMFAFDPDGPVGRLDGLSPDDGTIRLNWAVRGLEDPVEDAFVAPGLG